MDPSARSRSQTPGNPSSSTTPAPATTSQPYHLPVPATAFGIPAPPDNYQSSYKPYIAPATTRQAPIPAGDSLHSSTWSEPASAIRGETTHPAAAYSTNSAGALGIAEPGAFRGIHHPQQHQARPPSHVSSSQTIFLPPLKREEPSSGWSSRPAKRRQLSPPPSAADTSSIHPFAGPENVSFALRIRQQPAVARACGHGERDRRAVDPPPVLELDARPVLAAVPDLEDLQLTSFIVHASLWNDAGTEDITTLAQPSRPAIRRLVGSVAASAAVATDETDHRGAFFTFADLSCREPGAYRLHFTLVRIEPALAHAGAAVPVLATALSDVFRVYTPKEFPGMRQSTSLTSALKIQGVAIPAKKGRNFPAATKKGRLASEEAGSIEAEAYGSNVVDDT